jgi:hypothetical protein
MGSVDLVWLSAVKRFVCLDTFSYQFIAIHFFCGLAVKKMLCKISFVIGLARLGT